MSSYSGSRRVPLISKSDETPNQGYNFMYEIVLESPVPMGVVFWNMTDFAHTPWVHRKIYKSWKILARSQNVHLIEFKVRQLFFLGLPFVFRHLMWHEAHPPNRIRHLSLSPWGSYTKVEVTLKEFERDNKIHTLASNKYFMNFPKWLFPIRPLMRRYLVWWVTNLWRDDYPVLLRRFRVLTTGFRDCPIHGSPWGETGLLPT